MLSSSPSEPAPGLAAAFTRLLDAMVLLSRLL
jgi:hypothetical protein